MFEPLAKPQALVKNDELFHCTARGTDARGEYTTEGFVILKGSKGRGFVTASFKKTAVCKQWLGLLETGVDTAALVS